MATALAVLAVDYLILPPFGSLAIAKTSDAVALVLFATMGILISLLAEGYRRSLLSIAAYKEEQALWVSNEKLEDVYKRQLSKEEVARLINTSGSLFQRTFLMLLYSTGMRRSEVVRLTMLVMRSISFADNCMFETRTDMMRIYQFVTNCHSPKQPSFPTHLIAGRNP